MKDWICKKKWFKTDQELKFGMKLQKNQKDATQLEHIVQNSYIACSHHTKRQVCTPLFKAFVCPHTYTGSFSASTSASFPTFSHFLLILPFSYSRDRRLSRSHWGNVEKESSCGRNGKRHKREEKSWERRRGDNIIVKKINILVISKKMKVTLHRFVKELFFLFLFFIFSTVFIWSSPLV